MADLLYTFVTKGIDMTAEEKDLLVYQILAKRIPGRRFALSFIIPINDRVRMSEASEVIYELGRKGMVSGIKPTSEDLVFTVNTELETFSKRGGFKTEDIMYEAEIQKVLLEVSKLESEIDPSLYKKIMKILEPLAKLTGIAADIFSLA